MTAPRIIELDAPRSSPMPTTLSDDALRLAAEMRAEADSVLTGGPTWSDDSPKSTTGILRRGADTIDTLRRERDEAAANLNASRNLVALRERERDREKERGDDNWNAYSDLLRETSDKELEASATIAAQAAEIARKDAALADMLSICRTGGEATPARAIVDRARAALQPTETPSTFTVADADATFDYGLPAPTLTQSGAGEPQPAPKTWRDLDAERLMRAIDAFYNPCEGTTIDGVRAAILAWEQSR